jgi:hypothetical protein
MTGMLTTTRLSAASLWSRHGFGDGAPFEFEDRGQEHDDDPPHPDWTMLRKTLSRDGRDALLMALVRDHLAPAIAAATGTAPEPVAIGTSHNPVRDARMDVADMPEAWEGVHVDLPRDTVLAAARAIMEGEAA